MAGVSGAGKDIFAGADSGEAAFYHLQRNNPLGTTLLLQAALQRLERYPAAFGGISVSLLCSDIRERLRMLEASETVTEIVSARILPG